MSNLAGSASGLRLQGAIENLEKRHEKLGNQSALLQRSVLRGLGAGHVFTTAGIDTVCEVVHTLLSIAPTILRSCLETVPIEKCRKWSAQCLEGYELYKISLSVQKASKLALYMFIGPCAILWSPSTGISLHRSLGLRIERTSVSAQTRLQDCWGKGQSLAERHSILLLTTALALGGCVVAGLLGPAINQKLVANSDSSGNTTSVARRRYSMPQFLKLQCPLVQADQCSWDDAILSPQSTAKWNSITWLPRHYYRWIQADYENHGAVGFLLSAIKAVALCTACTGCYIWEFVVLNRNQVKRNNEGEGDCNNLNLRDLNYPIFNQFSQQKSTWCLLISAGLAGGFVYNILLGRL